MIDYREFVKHCQVEHDIIHDIIMWLFLNVELNSKRFKTDLAENFLYNWSESEKIETSKQDDMYTDFWAWLNSETKLFL